MVVRRDIAVAAPAIVHYQILMNKYTAKPIDSHQFGAVRHGNAILKTLRHHVAIADCLATMNDLFAEVGL